MPHSLYRDDPMPTLEIWKPNQCDEDYTWNFIRMKRRKPIYKSEEYFPQDVIVRETPAQASYKDYIMNAYRPIKRLPVREPGMIPSTPVGGEPFEKIKRRQTYLFESLNKRVQAESENDTKKICYLVITHCTFVDEASEIYRFYTKNANKVSKTVFADPTDADRKHLFDYFETKLQCYWLGAPYASFSAFKIEGEDMKLLFD